MYFETPFSDWSEVAALLLCATIAVPVLTIAGVKLFIILHKKYLDKQKKD